MKKIHLYFCGITVAALAACNGNNSGAGTSDSTMNRGDSSTTTTTTTTVVHHKYMGTFIPRPDVKYMDLTTHKQVTVRIDTVRGEVVNSQTDEPVYLFVAPNSTDTIYGQTGTIANTHISTDSAGLLKVDTVSLNATEVNTVTPPPIPADESVQGKYKEKDNGNRKKLKTSDEKVKERNGIIKEKDR